MSTISIPGLSADRQAVEDESRLMKEWGEWNAGLGEILQKNPEPEEEEGVMSVGAIGSQMYEWCKDNTTAVSEQIMQYGKSSRRRAAPAQARKPRRKTTSPSLAPVLNPGSWHRAAVSAGLSKLTAYLGLGVSKRKKKAERYTENTGKEDDYDDVDAGPVPPLARSASAPLNRHEAPDRAPPLVKSQSDNFRKPNKESRAERPTLRKRGKPLAAVSEGGEQQRALLPNLTEEDVKAMFCPPYYLLNGMALMSFVTDNVSELAAFSEQRKHLTLALLALSVVNFFCITTTSKCNVALLALRAVCDALNLVNAAALLLVSVWSLSLPAEQRALAVWFARYPSLSAWFGFEQRVGGAVLGAGSLLLGLLRVAHDLSIDIHPLLHETPHIVIGLLLLALIPSNVDDAGAGVFAGLGAGSAGAAGGGVAEAETALPWCKSHVLTTALAVALLNLAAPPHRAFGAPLIVMVLTSLWALGVACAGVTMGPAAVPRPGIPLFAILSVVCLLFSKHF